MGMMLPDGTIMYAKQGRPPPIPEGYERADNDPYVLRPKIPDCTLRQVEPRLLPCGKTVTYLRCSRGFQASSLDCSQCVAIGRQAQLLSDASLTSDIWRQRRGHH